MFHRHIQNRFIRPLTETRPPRTPPHWEHSFVRTFSPELTEYAESAQRCSESKGQRTAQGEDMMFVLDYVRDHPMAAAIDICAVAVLFLLVAGLWMIVP